MMSAMKNAFITHASDYLSKVWLALALASLAAIVCLCMSSKSKKKQTSRKTTTSAATTAASGSCIGDQDNTKPQLVFKALRNGRISEAVCLLQEMPETLCGHVPDEIAYRLLILASKMPKVCDVIADLKILTGKVKPEPFELAITETLRNKDVAACRQLHMISGLLSIPKTQAAFEGLASAYTNDASALRALVEEARFPLGRTFAEIALEACATAKDLSLAAEIFEKAASTDLAFLRGVAERARTTINPSSTHNSSSGRLSLSSCDKASTASSDGTDSDDGSASNAGGESYSGDALIRTTTFTTPKEVAMRANDIRSCGQNGDLRGASKVFDRLGSEQNTTLILNSMLDACVECNDLAKAIEYFQQAKENNIADVITYNTMMKGYIDCGQEEAAKQVLDELSQTGLSATRTSFHGLLNARVDAKDFLGAWKLVSDMQHAGISPNAVTCSILLNGKMTSLSDVSRVLGLIDAMDQPLDEVLFLSVVEACIRTGSLDLLSKQTEKFMRQGAAASLSAPTYGSMITAYGHACDLKRIWDLWGQMIAHSVQPTAVTLGCMVEALVGNGRTNDAWQLAQTMFNDEATKPLVNTAIYSSILNGFAHAKDIAKVMSVYEEMRAFGIQPNIITFNTIVNACAQCGAMHRVPSLLEDMKAATPPVEPDIVSTFFPKAIEDSLSEVEEWLRSEAEASSGPIAHYDISTPRGAPEPAPTEEEELDKRTEQREKIAALQRKNFALEVELVESHERSNRLADENKELLKTMGSLRKRIGLLEHMKVELVESHERSNRLADENKELLKTVGSLRKRIGLLEHMKVAVMSSIQDDAEKEAEIGDSRAFWSESYLRSATPLTAAALGC